MDPVTLIVTALAAGAASALQDGASAAVKDAYARLRAAVKKRLAGRPEGELVLAEHEAAPQTWQAPLAAELSAAGAEGDADLVAAAQGADETGRCGGVARRASTWWRFPDSQGVQVGDRNTQTNTSAQVPADPGGPGGMGGSTGGGEPPVTAGGGPGRAGRAGR